MKINIYASSKLRVKLLTIPLFVILFPESFVKNAKFSLLVADEFVAVSFVIAGNNP